MDLARVRQVTDPVVTIGPVRPLALGKAPLAARILEGVLDGSIFGLEVAFRQLSFETDQGGRPDLATVAVVGVFRFGANVLEYTGDSFRLIRLDGRWYVTSDPAAGGP